MKNFELSYFHGPFAEFMEKPEVIADIAASGMTLVPLHYDTETNLKALPLLAHYGLRAIVSDPRIRAVYNKDDLAGADAAVKEVVSTYADYDNIIGWDIVDEPKSTKFPVLAAIVRACHRYSPDKETVINLFPNYASPEQLGNPDYASHLEAFINIVNPDLLSYDHYHFLGRKNRQQMITENIDERERQIRLAAEKTENRAGFFENIEIIREKSLKYDIDPMLIVLLTEHGPYRNLTRAELFWEVNMCLAYGMRRISYFTYWEPVSDEHWAWDNAMCDTKGIKMPHYYDVQEINRTILDIGQWLFDKTSEAVFHIGRTEPETRAFTAYGGIDSIDGENGVIGFFEDGSAYLVNRDFQHENTFVLHTDRPVSIRKNGHFETTESPFFTLGAGEAVLLKL